MKPIPTNSLTVQDKGTVAVQESHATVAVHDSHCTFDQGSSKSVPTIILKGCTFSECAVAFSGPASNVNNDSVAAEVLDGINLSTSDTLLRHFGLCMLSYSGLNIFCCTVVLCTLHFRSCMFYAVSYIKLM